MAVCMSDAAGQFGGWLSGMVGHWYVRCGRTVCPVRPDGIPFFASIVLRAFLLAKQLTIPPEKVPGWWIRPIAQLS
jgi:hypothetical protein